MIWFDFNFFNNSVKIEVDIDLVRFDLPEITELKITYIINSKNAYKLAPRSTYYDKREKSVSSVLNQTSYFSLQPQLPYYHT